MDGGFGEFVVADESMLYRLTPEISDRHAALVEVFSIGFHACNRSGLKAGDSVAIWGTGRIGHSILQAARTKTDITIFMVDILDSRLKIAAGNFENVIPINSAKQDPIAVIKEYTNGRGVDIAFEAVGHAHTLAERPNPVRGCVQSIRGAGTVCVLGLADDPAPLVMKELIWKEAKIIASRVSHGEFAEAIHHLSLGNLKPDCVISLELPAREAQSAFELLDKEPENYIKVLLKLG
jgi:threonine dehydrogenase-like Zn-dependent dehydrogenase